MFYPHSLGAYRLIDTPPPLGRRSGFSLPTCVEIAVFGVGRYVGGRGILSRLGLSFIGVGLSETGGEQRESYASCPVVGRLFV